MPQRTVSDLIVERLKAWGVDRVFGYSGDGINGFMGALRRAGEDAVEFVQARHEETAAFMAVGHAKYTGGVGVVTSTQGPGAVHLLNGLYDAKLDGVPVVAIIGQQSRSVLGSAYMQEIDLLTLFKDVAAQFAQMVSSPEQLPMVLDRAFRTALETKVPVRRDRAARHPEAPAPELDQEHGIVVTAPEWRPARVMPARGRTGRGRRGARCRRAGGAPGGPGCRGAQAEVVALAEKLNAGITTSLLGKPYVDETLPFAAGTMGHLGTTASAHLLGKLRHPADRRVQRSLDGVLPQTRRGQAVQIDIDGRKIGNRYPVEVGLVGDAAETLRELSARLGQAAGPALTHAVAGRRRGAGARLARTCRRNAPASRPSPVNPERVVRELNGRLPADAQVSIDVGSCVYWYARQLVLPSGVPAHLSGTLASMGCAIPYGIAAKLAHPERPLVALAGDGAHADAGRRGTDHRRAPVAGLGGSAVRGLRLQQPRPRRGLLGAARNGGRAALPRQPGHPGLPVCRLRGTAGAEGCPRRRPCAAGRRLGRSAFR